MLATLTISGSGAASTQTACGRRARTMRSETIRCSRRSLSLRSSCSPRWSSTAGSELRRVEPARATVETLAPERRTSSSGLAPMNAASGVPTQKQKQAGNCSRMAPKSAAGSWAAPAPTTTSRASTTLLISPASIRVVAAATAASKSPGGRALRISACEVGCGSSSGSGASARRPASRAASAAPRASTSSPGWTTALTVRKERSLLRQSESSGRTSEPGDSEDQVEEAPPSASKAKPPSQTGPAPAGSPRGSSRIASRPVRRHSSATSAKRSSPREAASCATPSPARAKSRSGCSQQNQRSEASREANDRRAGIGDLGLDRDADQGPPPPLHCPLDALAQAGRCFVSRYLAQSRSLQSGPFRPGRGGGPCARRPRSCRRSRSPRSSSCDGRRRRSWPGRSPRTG